MTTELITFTNSSLKEREHFDAKKIRVLLLCNAQRLCSSRFCRVDDLNIWLVKFFYYYLLPEFSFKVIITHTMLLPQQKFRQIISVLFLLVEWTQPTENVEIIYPAAPLFHKRFGNSSTTAENGGCDCATVEIVTANEPVLRKHGELLGKYSKMESVENSPNGLYNGRPAFEHFSGRTNYILL